MCARFQTGSVANPYLLRLKCFLCHAPNPNVNDENNNWKKDDSEPPAFTHSLIAVLRLETHEKSFNPISEVTDDERVHRARSFAV